MPRNQHSHLTQEEISRLVEEEFGPATDIPWTDRDAVVQHMSECETCGPQVRAQRLVQESIRRLVSSVASERTVACPSEDKWLPLTVGVFLPEEAAPLLNHAVSCDYCGRLLRQTKDALGTGVSIQEKEILGELTSLAPEWQRGMAQRLAEESSATNRKSEVAKTFGFWNWGRLAMAGAAVVVIAVTAGIWVSGMQSQADLAEANRLIAQAYTEQRPFEMRLEGAAYGPVRQQRGNGKLESPQALKEAKQKIAEALDKHPDEPGWLQTKGKVDLLEGNYAAAIRSLEQALSERPSVSLKLDLAVAYFEDFEATGNPQNRGSALRYLDEIVAATGEAEAIFNRAILFEREKDYSRALEDWDRYLQQKRPDRWAVEAQQRRESIKSDSGSR